MEFIKIDNVKFKELFNFDIDSNIDTYILKDQSIIGYGLIANTNQDTIRFHILEEHRSKGYGTMLFRELINKIKEQSSYSEISLTIEKENINANNIIKNNGGIEVLSEKNKVHYIFPIKNKTS